MGRSARSHCSRSGQAAAPQGDDRIVHALWIASYHVVDRLWSRCDEADSSADAGRNYHIISYGIDCVSADLCDLEMELGSEAGTEA